MFANSSKRHYNRRTFDSELMDRETPTPPLHPSPFSTKMGRGWGWGLALPEFPGGSLDSSSQFWSGFSLRAGAG